MAAPPASVVSALVQIGSAVAQGQLQANLDKQNQGLRTAQAQARDQVRRAKNVAEGSSAGLTNALRSLNNNRAMRAAAKGIERGRQAASREQEARSANSFEASVRAAEESGSARAAAAFSGVTGNVTDVIESTKLLTTLRAQERDERDQDVLLYQTAQEDGARINAAIAGQDIGFSRPGVNAVDINATPGQVRGGPLYDILGALKPDNINALLQYAGDFFKKPVAAPVSGTIASLPEFSLPAIQQVGMLTPDPGATTFPVRP